MEDQQAERPDDPDRIDALLADGAALGILFSAPWCTAGTLLTRELDPDHRLVIVDCDQHPHVADRFQVRSLPTLLLMEGLKERGRLLGAFSTGDVTALLAKLATK